MTGVGPEQVLHVPGHNLEHANLPSYQTSPGPSLFHRGVPRTPREKREANSAPKGLRFVPGTPVASEDVPQVRAHEVWENQQEAACIACGLHGAREGVPAESRV